MGYIWLSAWESWFEQIIGLHCYSQTAEALRSIRQISLSKWVTQPACILSSSACFTYVNSQQGPKWPCYASEEIFHSLRCADLAYLLGGRGGGLPWRVAWRKTTGQATDWEQDFTQMSPCLDLGAGCIKQSNWQAWQPVLTIFHPSEKSVWLHRLTSKVAVIVKMSESAANTDLLPARYIWPDVMRRGLLPPSSCWKWAGCLLEVGHCSAQGTYRSEWSCFQARKKWFRNSGKDY